MFSTDVLRYEVEKQGEQLREGLHVIVDQGAEEFEAEGILELEEGRWSAQIVPGTYRDKSVWGVQRPRLIDGIKVEGDGRCILTMRETRTWEGSADRLTELREKFNTYMVLIFDGMLAKMYPKTAIKSVRIELICEEGPPDSESADLIGRLRSWAARGNIEFVVRVRG